MDRRGADAAKLAELAFEVAGGQTPCASAPDMFYAEKFGFDIADSFGYGDQSQVTEAKQLCNTVCEIRNACLEYALNHNETYGIWGGTSPRERMGLLRRRRGRLSEADVMFADEGDE